MSQIQLTPAQRREHRANAHHLTPVVLIGGDGLTDAVKQEVDAALNAHGLIKVRVFSDDRAGRELIYQTLSADLSAAPVQHIGKLLVLWRPQVEKERVIDEDRMPGPKDVKILKYSKRGGQRPEVKTLRVLGNQRLTQGGTIKRARPKPAVSVKKRQDAVRSVRCPAALRHLHEMGHQIWAPLRQQPLCHGAPPSDGRLSFCLSDR